VNIPRKFSGIAIKARIGVAAICGSLLAATVAFGLPATWPAPPMPSFAASALGPETATASMSLPIPLPAWQSFAVPSQTGSALVAVIIDDMGLDRPRSARVLALPAPLTISFMTYAGHLDEQAAQARQQGHEVMLHVPMQPLSASFDAGPEVLSDDLPSAELRRRLVGDLDRLAGGYVGINNHMGSRFTANPAGMRVVMAELHKRGLLFIDSLTNGASVGIRMARQNGVPAAARDVFLDNAESPSALARQLERIEILAHRNGSVIVIGHPHDGTITALAAWLPSLPEKGLTLVPVTAVVMARAAN